MIGERRVVAIIPARGGSKSIKHKNLSLVNGKSLIQRSVECAKSSLYIDRIIVEELLRIHASMFPPASCVQMAP